MKVLYAASEALPFMASGGLADVAGSLPKALNEKGIDCRVIMPLYSGIAPAMRDKMQYVTSFSVSLGWRKQYCGIFEAIHNGVVYYFVDNEYYFKRDKIYGFGDDNERFAFFARAIVEMISYVDFVPDILHLNDWQTALSSVYLNLFYRHIPKYSNIKTVFTIHNIQYQGQYGMDILEELLGISSQDRGVLEFDGDVNYMKAAIVCSDRISTVSPSYAKEIMDPWYSHGLDSMLRQEAGKLCGILNGIDIDLYNCETDPLIYKTFSAETLVDKEINKQELCKEMGIVYDPEKPVVGMVTRLVSHKGLDLVKYIFEEIIESGMQAVILGSGDYVYEEFFRNMAERYPDDVGVKIGFIPALAHKIYAGADLFLMPSKSEPCGLSQMVATRYATVPIIRETGGLKDSIIDFGRQDVPGCGYTFQSYNAHDMLHALNRAKEAYSNKETWAKQLQQVLASDFSWEKSAGEYIKMYESI